MIASGVWKAKKHKHQAAGGGSATRVEGTEEQARRDRMATACQGPLGSRMERPGWQIRRHGQAGRVQIRWDYHDL